MVSGKRKQTNLSDFFGGSKLKKTAHPVVKTKSSSERALQVKTAENWKTTKLAKYNGENWLIIVPQKNDKNSVEALKCSVCIQLKDEINSIKGFNMQWIEGSKRLMLGTALDHANSEPHKKSNGPPLETTWTFNYRMKQRK